MLNAILGIACAASMALAPSLVKPSPSETKSDGYQTSQVKRAYYDADSVSNYGTTNGKCYNYTSYTLYQEEDEEYEYGVDSGRYFNTWVVVNSSNVARFQIYDEDLDIGNADEIIANTDNPLPLDLYLNGVYYATLTPNGNGRWMMPICNEGWENDYSAYYLWLFDHEDPAPMSQTIIETAGDATTAAAAVIGAGFTGIISLFYNEGLTGLGILALIAVGVSLVWFALALILRLWKGRA